MKEKRYWRRVEMPEERSLSYDRQRHIDMEVFETDGKAERQENPKSGFEQVLCLEKEISDLEQEIEEAEKKLENVQDKLAHTERRKAEAEAQTESVVKNTERRKAEFLQEIKKLEKRKASLEKRCDELSGKNGQMVSYLGMKSRELQDQKAGSDKAGNRQDPINQKHKSGKKRDVLKAVFGILGVIMLLDWIYLKGEISRLETSKKEVLAELSDMEEYVSELEAGKERALVELSNKEGYISELETSKEEALTELSDMEEYISELEAREAIVKVNSVYNSDNYGDKIGKLKASEMRYLYFDLNVSFLEENVKGATIYIDIYYPDGTLKCSEYSPDGHTFSIDADKSGNVTGGWGSSGRSTYPSGTYRVDLIYKDAIVHSQEVEISD